MLLTFSMDLMAKVYITQPLWSGGHPWAKVACAFP